MWIELSQLLEGTDLSAAVAAYNKAIALMTEQVNMEIPPEILNNIAALQYRLGNHTEALEYFEKAWDRCEAEREQVWFNSLWDLMQLL